MRQLFNLDPTPTGAASVARDRRLLARAVGLTLGFIALLWFILGVQLAGRFDLGMFGVRPREWAGLLGVLTAPLVHAGVPHLMANTPALLVLGVLALRVYPRATARALPWIWLGSGLLVWLFARPDTHIGASGIAHGLMFFLFVLGLFRRERLAIVTSMVVFFLYGGMVHSILPHDPHVSWEYHLAGAVCGTVAALLTRRLDPLPPRKRYSWDEEGAGDEPAEDLSYATLARQAELAEAARLRPVPADEDDSEPPDWWDED
ncbi:MAG TPA: rhomboid family intramembrane serine protease [Rhodanobacteraceae bacterium]|nr:rhomboid family intramembrane serine protease [Rhodanobacteraceae bacterium]